MGTRVIAAAALVVGAVCLSIVSGCGGESTADAQPEASTSAPAAGGAIPVLLGGKREFTVAVPSRAAAGRIDFAVTNGGTVDHELVVIRTDRAASDLGSTRADETGKVDEVELGTVRRSTCG